MYDYLIPMSPLLATFVFLVWYCVRRRDCPDCGAPLPVFYSPFRKTRRMWRAGGYLCARCECETDINGRKVSAGTPLPAVPVGLCVLAGVLVLVGLGLGGALIAGSKVAAPPFAVAPPVVDVPQQGPPAARAP